MKKSILRMTGFAAVAALFCVLYVTCNDNGAGNGRQDDRADAFVSKFNRNSAHNHQWSGWVITTDARCSSGEWMTRTCETDPNHKESYCYEWPDSGTPIITLKGSANVSIEARNTYSDAGVTVTFAFESVTRDVLLDSVVVRGTNSNNNYKLKVEKIGSAQVNFSDVKLTADNHTPTAGNTYTITYYASYTSPSGRYPKTYSTAVRNVTVI